MREGARRMTAPKAIIAFAATAIAVMAVIAASLGLYSANGTSEAEGLPAKDAADGFPKIDWDWWLAVNPDIVGWVSVPGTAINQPIVQAPAADPTFYLRHSVSKFEDPAGCPFLDAGCLEEGLSSWNCMIFGHHWTERSMFADFAKYLDAAFADEHSEILLQTPSSKKRLEVLFVEMTPGSAQTKLTDFASREEFECWLQGRYESSCVKLADAPGGDACPRQIFTFCTCSYSTYKNERTLVYAAQICK